ncbi:UNVERIFIED_CONTAM: hypothetical protein Scaly_1925500 [Sesamum calycinum]|uniref:DUF8040 domain-containing protein n=1 Tax=Sesamum calycinum TaxID=2727403 RepID=A0AAW2NGI1_9LAMI
MHPCRNSPQKIRPCARVLGPPLFRTKAMIQVWVQHLGFIYLGQADVVQIWVLDNRWCSGLVRLKEYIGRKRFRRCRYSLTTRMPDQTGRLYRLVSSNDETCLRNLRMDRNAFGRLCYILEQSGGVRPTKNVSVPEQVAMFLSVLSHHKKNCVVKHDFIRSGRTVSKHFHVVLNAVCKMHKVLLAKPSPIADDCSDPRWKWFKFIFVLSGWEGSAADSRVLRDAIHRPNGLTVPTGAMDADFFSTAHVNTLDDDGSSQQKRRGNNKDRSGPRRTWTLVEEEALINGLSP